jgi:thioesterase domain-containing protein
MVPNVFVTLDALPRLTNGKLDRKSLPAPQSVTVSPIARAHVRPRGPVERRLARVWEAVLGQDGMGVTDDFFDLGGHSILALKLVSAIQVAFGRSVPLARLLAHPTIERLALALTRDHDPEDWRPLVAITRGGQGRPLFLLPGAGGNVLYFQALAHAMKSARPIYGLQAVGLDGRTPPLTQIEAMAAVNIDAIRREFPQGPYSLAGHSFGGQVALEMARQLSEQGHAVDLLAILDTAAPAFERDDIGAHLSDAGWLAKIAQEIEEFFGVALGVTFSDLDPLPLDRQLALIVERMQRAGVWAPGAGTEQLHGYLEVYKANSQAVQVRYDGATPRVPIVLFKAMDRDADIDAVPVSLQALHAERAWGWDRFATGDVRVIDVPGAHLSMLGAPHVITLARALDDVIG